MVQLQQIISGGQTGVDRGAHDAALRLGRPCGGWCPRGRRAEDGRIPARYPLVEVESPVYAVRTRRNVEDTDGTLVLAHGIAEGGTALTIDYAEKMGRPCLVLDLAKRPLAETVMNWARENAVRHLNVAGPRASSVPEVQALADVFMTSLLVADAAD